jgi:hypothetical protein
MITHDIKQTRMGDHRIRWDDCWQSIEIYGYVISLSPTQYRICHAFLTYSTPSTISGELIIFSYRELKDLQHEVELPSRHLLTKHISVLNARINVHGLRILPFHQGYALTLTASITSSRLVR